MEKLTLLISMATLAIVMEYSLATEHAVGAPDGGWDALTALEAWASPKTFIVGDKLVFSYGPTHDVLQVSKEDYESCNPNNAVSVYAGGLSTILLTTPGKNYFICGTTDHCALGMKLQIDVLTSALPPPPPTVPLSPPHASPPTPSWTHAPWSAPEPVSSPVSSPSHSPHYAPKNAPSKAPVKPNGGPAQAVSGPNEAPTASPAPPDLAPSPSAATTLNVLTGSTMGSILAITMLLVL